MTIKEKAEEKGREGEGEEETARVLLFFISILQPRPISKRVSEFLCMYVLVCFVLVGVLPRFVVRRSPFINQCKCTWVFSYLSVTLCTYRNQTKSKKTKRKREQERERKRVGILWYRKLSSEYAKMRRSRTRG